MRQPVPRGRRAAPVEHAQRVAALPLILLLAVVASLSEVLELCNQRFSTSGAFILESGFAVKAEQSAGNVFMKYGNALAFHTKVDFTRIAYAMG